MGCPKHEARENTPLAWLCLTEQRFFDDGDDFGRDYCA